ncbi:MAG: putative porin [Gammaproteobacteria bacterium]|nr:putative porin [Gammaproteobacteria bacterium]
MFKKTALFAGLALALTGTVQAEEYSWEAGAGISGSDVEGFDLGISYFFQPVDDSKGPYREAAFIDRASSVTVFGSDGEVDNSADTEEYGIDVRYITAGSGWIIDAAYARSEASVGGFDAEVDAYGLTVGKYIAENTTLEIGYAYAEDDSGAELDNYGIEIQHLMNWEDSGLKLGGGYVYSETDDGGNDRDTYFVEATWYPCKNLGIGGGYSLADGEFGDTDIYSIGAEYFITEHAAVSLSYLSEEVDDTDLESDVYRVGVNFRF